MSENGKAPPFGYNGRGDPATPKEQQTHTAYWDSRENAIRQRAIQLIKQRDAYIPTKERDRER